MSSFSVAATAGPSRLQRVLRDLRLAWGLSKRDLTNRYVGSYAGAFWTIGVPLINALLYVIVFSTLMRGRMGERYGDVPFVAFFLMPFSLWIFVTEMFARSATILREYQYLINKVAFPVWILPLVPIASSLLSQIIVVACCVAVMWIQGVAPASGAWLYLVIAGLVLVMAIGFSYLVAAIAAYIPDMAQVVPIFLNILFWMTPLLYTPEMLQGTGIGDVVLSIMGANPMYYAVETSRMVVFGASGPLSQYLEILAAIAIAAAVGGSFVFRKLRVGFADVL